MNTLENKGKFFAQYHGQKVACSNLYGKYNEVYSVDVITLVENGWLELTPTSQIKDADAEWLARRWYVSDYVEKNLEKAIARAKREVVGNQWVKTYDVIDFLRSRGYAVPWMGISVEQQIEWGWIKLRK